MTQIGTVLYAKTHANCTVRSLNRRRYGPAIHNFVIFIWIGVLYSLGLAVWLPRFIPPF